MSNLHDNPDGSSPESDALVAAQNLAATSQLIDRLYSAGVLSGTGRVAAMNIVNGPLAWWPWVEKALLFLGLALTLSGVVCFFAWNWDALPGLAKLAIVQAGIVGCCVVACQKKIATLPGKAAITGAAVLVGVFLAVFGQVYQTGAAAYQLFVGWALLTSSLDGDESFRRVVDFVAGDCQRRRLALLGATHRRTRYRF